MNQDDWYDPEYEDKPSPRLTKPVVLLIAVAAITLVGFTALAVFTSVGGH